MNKLRDTDEVVTTLGSILLSLEQSYAEGQKTEQERIIKLLEENDHHSVDWLIELIKGETNE